MSIRRRAASPLIALVALAAAGCGGSPSQPSEGPPLPPALSAPVPDSPGPSAQLTSLEPVLQVRNATSDQAGPRTYQFQVSSSADFTTIDAAAQNVPEGPSSTSWTVAPSLLPNTIYWWRARAEQGATTGPWTTALRFKSRLQGYSVAGELFDPLTEGTTIGTGTGSLTFIPGQGVRLNDLGSRVRYALPQTISAGEFSLQVTGLDNASAGESTKLFSMHQGSDDLTTNPYRGTVDKRDDGTVSFRLIAGDPDTRADANRSVVAFSPSTTYLWRFTWGAGTARLVITEDDEQGRVVFSNARSYSGTYSPQPHIAHLGAPPGRDGLRDASVPERSSATCGLQAAQDQPASGR